MYLNADNGGSVDDEDDGERWAMSALYFTRLVAPNPGSSRYRLLPCVDRPVSSRALYSHPRLVIPVQEQMPSLVAHETIPAQKSSPVNT